MTLVIDKKIALRVSVGRFDLTLFLCQPAKLRPTICRSSLSLLLLRLANWMRLDIVARIIAQLIAPEQTRQGWMDCSSTRKPLKNPREEFISIFVLSGGLLVNFSLFLQRSNFYDQLAGAYN
jgi:hypothetical protein